MHLLVTNGSQFIIATHSPILLGYPGATIYLFTDRGLTSVPYTETEHYQITKASRTSRPDAPRAAPG
jgi:predicted ATPase